MQDAKEEVRARLSIEDVIGQYVELKRAGRNLKGLSPFTDERTPSFMVSPEKQIWHDFSSGRGGDIFSFIMEVEGMDFRESLEHLARKAGVELQQFSGNSGEFAKRKERARQALDLASRYFQQVLVKNQKSLDYAIKKRQLNRQIIEDFKIGFAPDSGGLVEALQKRGFSQKEVADAGLVNRFGGDLFKGRLMVALMDGSGEVVGFTGRIINDDPKAPKYLNTPQTILFDKGRHIFGLSQAKEAIRKAESAVIVEGNLDVVSSHQAGVRNVVATAGTAMTEHHLKALSRLAGRIRLAFDGDRAGLAATERAITLAQDIDVVIEVVSLPDQAKDPDELIRQDPALWSGAIEAAIPAVEWVINEYAKREALDTAEGKRKFTTAALELVGGLKDPVERDHYMEVLQSQTGVSRVALDHKLEQRTETSQPKLQTVQVKKQAAVTANVETEEALTSLIIAAPSTRRWLNAIEDEMIESEEVRLVVNYLRDNPHEQLTQVPKNLQKIEQYVKIVQLKNEVRYADWEDSSYQSAIADTVKKLISKHRKTKIAELTSLLREAEESGDDARSGQLRHDINALIKERV